MSRSFVKRMLFRVHVVFERFGVHVLPVHYYSPVPSNRQLKRDRSRWARRSALTGIHVDLDEQLASLRAVCVPYQDEYAGNRFFNEGVQHHFGPGYGYIEAQALHGVIRHFKPRRIVEVGSGVSTYCMVKADELNAAETGVSAEIVSIEPNPSPSLRALAGIDLLAQPVQDIEFGLFERLGPHDLLFIDSSHAVRTDSDVNFLILEVLPRLGPGVIVHLHDINFPYDYQRDVLHSFFEWSESSLLQAFLAHNPRIRILFCLSHLHYDRQSELRGIFPEYQPQSDEHGLLPSTYRPFDRLVGHFPASIYLRTL